MAYNEFDAIPGQGRFDFARDRFLSIKTLQQVANNKRQLLENLSTLGLVPRGIRTNHVEWVGRRHDGSDGVRLVLGQRPIAEVVAAGDGAGDERARRDGTNPRVTLERRAPRRSGRFRPRSSRRCSARVCTRSPAYVHAPPTKKGAASSTAVQKLHVRAADRALSEPDAASRHSIGQRPTRRRRVAVVLRRVSRARQDHQGVHARLHAGASAGDDAPRRRRARARGRGRERRTAEVRDGRGRARMRSSPWMDFTGSTCPPSRRSS